MNKQHYDEELETWINMYESEELLTLEDRINRLKTIVKLGREYNLRYKNPHKHYFMGKPIKYSNAVLNALEEIAIQAEILNNEKKKENTIRNI